MSVLGWPPRLAAAGGRPAATIRRLAAADGGRWDRFVDACGSGSIYQSADFAEVNAIAGWRSELLVVEESDTIRGGALIMWKGLPLLRRAVARIENGFLLADPFDDGAAERLWDGIRAWSAERRVGVLQVRPHVAQQVGGVANPEAERLDRWMRAHGGRPAEHRAGTYWLDLTRDEDDLWAAAAPHFRRQARKALRAGTTVRFTFDTGMIEPLFEYYTQMRRRKDLAACYPREFFDRGVACLLARRRCVIALTESGGNPGAFALVSLPGVPRYLVGASAPARPEAPAGPAAGHLLHWEVARWLKARGRSRYDLGGAPGPVPQPGHPNYGVWRFKHDLRPAFVDYVGTYEFAFSAPIRILLRRALPVYRWWTGGGE